MHGQYLSIEAFKETAVQFMTAGDNASAVLTFNNGINQFPDSLELYVLNGLLQGQLGSYQIATEYFRRAVQIDKGSLEGWLGLGMCLENEDSKLEVLSANQNAIEILSTREVQSSTTHEKQVLELFKKSIRIFSDQKLFEQALNFTEYVLIRYPGMAEVYTSLGIILDQKRVAVPSQGSLIDKSLLSYTRAILIDSNRAENHYFYANILSEMSEWRGAINGYQQALRLNPHHLESLNNLAIAYQALNDLKNANYYFLRSVEIVDKDPQALRNTKLSLAQLFFNAGALALVQFQDEVAKNYFERALQIDSSYPQLLGAYVHLRMKLCDWQTFTQVTNPKQSLSNTLDLSGLIATLLSQVQSNQCLVHPFVLLSLTDQPNLHLQASIRWGQNILKCAKVTNQVDPAKIELRLDLRDNDLVEVQEVTQSKRGIGIAKSKIRIGYFSSDFKEHATAYLIASLFELHDKDEFEIVAYSWGVDDKSLIRERIKSSFSSWYEVGHLSDEQLVVLARSHKLNVAIDLKGYTQGARTGVFARRVAPVQISYLGYPGTLGGEFMDYTIVDSIVAPNQLKPYMTEKLIHLPISYQVNDHRQVVSSRRTLKVEHGLYENAIVLGAMNSSYKITPEIFEIWMSILKSHEKSVLWLLVDTQTVANNLLRSAESSGVDSTRMVFANRVSHPEHLERLRHADLFLDTFPCNGHTTSSDALWSGVPLVTLCGESFSSRVASSLLEAVGLKELVTISFEGYKSKVQELLADPVYLANIKKKLLNKKERGNISLFDTHNFVVGYENAIKSIF